MKSQGEPPPDPPPHPSPREASRTAAGGGRATLAAILAVVMLAALLLWVSQAIVAHNRLQNCIDSGRRTCLQIEPGNDGS